jgi:ankyrin repeat protein
MLITSQSTYSKSSPSSSCSDKDSRPETTRPSRPCDGTALHQAARRGHQSIVRFLVEHGAQVSMPDEHGQTLLHLAAQNGHEDLVQYALAEGCAIDTKDYNGYTSLHLAAENGQESMVKLLVEAGASIDL